MVDDFMMSALEVSVLGFVCRLRVFLVPTDIGCWCFGRSYYSARVRQLPGIIELDNSQLQASKT